MEKWDPAWQARKFVELYVFFMGNLERMYPECPLVAHEKREAEGLAGAPEDVVDKFIGRWHTAMDTTLPTANGDPVSFYTLAKRRDDALFTSRKCAVCERLGMGDKWAQNDVDPNSRECIRLYFQKLNKYARFVALAPRQILSAITELAASKEDLLQPQVMQSVMQRLGPQMASNFEQLTNATALVGDILEEHMGADVADQIMGVVQQMSGNDMNLEELTSLLPMMLGGQVPGLTQESMSQMIQNVQTTAQTIQQDNPGVGEDPNAMAGAMQAIMDQVAKDMAQQQ